jgi:hypothetical protein
MLQEFDKAAAAKKQNDSVETFTSSAPTALAKLSEKNDDVSKLTKPETCSLLFACYGAKTDEKKHLKPKLVEMLRDKISENPGAVASAVTALIAAAAPPASTEPVADAGSPSLD